MNIRCRAPVLQAPADTPGAMDDLRRDLRKLVRQMLDEHDPTDRQPVAELIRAHLGGEPGAAPIFTEELAGWELPNLQRRGAGGVRERARRPGAHAGMPGAGRPARRLRRRPRGSGNASRPGVARVLGRVDELLGGVAGARRARFPFDGSTFRHLCCATEMPSYACTERNSARSPLSGRPVGRSTDTLLGLLLILAR